MNESIVEVSDLKKIYSPSKNPVEALKGVNFAVRRGEVFGILGVNGAGKSTLLNILIGLLTASSGRVKIFGRNFFQHEEEAKAKMNIATAYADLGNNLTIYRNLKVFAIMYGVKDYEKKIANLMEQFGVAHLRDKWFGDLSAGEKTRVNLCKSLINDPELLLLDEPTASLDPSIASRVRGLLLQLQKKRKLTIIVTSHNMLEVERVCDRVALLHHGQIYRIDTTQNLKKFLKVPSMEEVFLKLAKGEFDE